VAYSQGTVSPSSPAKAVYTPKGFFPHAASRGQGFPHCPHFQPAASRRSGARVSVPLGPAALSRRLPVLGLVGRYPTNYLMGHRPLPGQILLQDPFLPQGCPQGSVWGISPPFGRLSPSPGQVSGVLLRRPPLGRPIRAFPARLAWLRHAASVSPEPGSNPPKLIPHSLFPSPPPSPTIQTTQ
jgi:hypothetical protein